MNYTLKNLSGMPLDVPTLAGPRILPAYGEITADLGALDTAVMEESPYVEATKASEKPVEKTDDRELDDLRGQYEELFGEAPDGRWGEKRLRDEIDAKLAE